MFGRLAILGFQNKWMATTIQQRFSTHSSKTYYDVLNLSRNCTIEQVRDSFAKLSKQYHPDTCKTGNIADNAKKFQEIMEAYRVLSRKKSRESYDAEITGIGRNYYNTDGATRRPYNDHEYEYEIWRRKMNGMNTTSRQYQFHQYDDWYHRTHRPYPKTNANHTRTPPPLSSRMRVYIFIGVIVYVFIAISTYSQIRVHQDFNSAYPRRHVYGHGTRTYGEQFTYTGSRSTVNNKSSPENIEYLSSVDDSK